MTTWSEIRQLADQLKATQDQSSIYNLSERTWVDIIRNLTSSNRLKLTYTTDGRSYITHEELCKEIREEVEAHSGRISLTELASNLDVDPLIIEARVSELVSADAHSNASCGLLSIPGEVINKAHVRSISQDIQDLLEVRGQITIGQLATNFGLPTAFLTNILTEQGNLFRLQQYGEKYFTDKYLSENRARVRGYFSALTRPIVLPTVATKLNLPEGLLSSLVNGLISSTQLCGQLIAARGMYVPACYANAEDSYINAFYAQNGYVEWNYLKRLGISDPGSYLRSKLPAATHLSGVSIGTAIIHQVKAHVEEAVRESSWVDLTHCLPVSLTSKERLAILNPNLSGVPVRMIEDGLYLVSEELIIKCESFFKDLILSKAEVACRSEPKVLNTSRSAQATTERDAISKRSNTQAKGGFGIGAREIRSKNVKNKYVPGKRKTGAKEQNINATETDYTDNAAGVENLFSKYITEEELVCVLTSKLPSDVPEDVIGGIIATVLPSLERSFTKAMESIFTPNSGIANRRQSMAQTQEIVNNTVFAIQLIERSILAIDLPSLRSQLTRHLARSHASDLVDRLCFYLAQYYEVNWPDVCGDDSKVMEQNRQTDSGAAKTSTSMQQKMKLVELLNRTNVIEPVEETIAALQKLIEQLRIITGGAATELAEYYHAVSCLAVDCLGMNVTAMRARPDKRKREERMKANELAVQTETQLADALDALLGNNNVVQAAATAALSATCLLVQAVTGWPVVAPGKCVPELSAWLTEYVAAHRCSPGSSAVTPAISAVITSTAVEDLGVLIGFVTKNMHTQDNLRIDPIPTDAIHRLLELSKTSRKLLYN